jgi:hypothetical protein
MESTDRQGVFREQVSAFFANDKHFFRLKRVLDTLIANETRVANEGELMFFFLNRYRQGVVVRSESGRLFKICEEYKSALANYRKRYFDFGSRVGMGELRWKGETNPAIVIRDYAMPLPKVVAFMWLLQSELDYIFLGAFDEIFASFIEFTCSTKERYMLNQRLRQEKKQV